MAEAKRRPLLWLLFILAVLAGYGLVNSPLFRVERITVQGNEYLTTNQLVEATGIYAGELLWGDPTAQVRHRLALTPWVAEVDVRWGRPGELLISITEREPLALLPYFHYYLLVDREGRTLELSPDLVSVRLPVITGLPETPVPLGHAYGGAGLAGALNALAALPLDWRAEIAEVHVDGRGELTLYGLGGVTIELGPPTQLAEKVVSLVTGWSQVKEEQMSAQLIDVRDPSRPYIRLHE